MKSNLDPNFGARDHHVITFFFALEIIFVM